MEGSNLGDATDRIFCPQPDVTKQLSSRKKRVLQSTMSLPEGGPAEDASSLRIREKQLAKGLANLEVQNKQLDRLRRSVEQELSYKENKLVMDEENLKK